MRTKLLHITIIVSTLFLVLVFTQTGCPAPPPPINEPGTEDTTKPDSGGETTTNPDDAKPKDDTVTPEVAADVGKEAVPENTVTPETKPETVIPDGGVCPPGCDKCSQGPVAKKKLGETCTPAAAGQEEPCDTGLKCLETRVLNGRFYRPINLCLQICQADGDCKKDGETCANPNPGIGTDTACGIYKKTGEACDANVFNFCAQPATGLIHCLVKDINNDDNGTCTVNCAQDATVCDTAAGKLCRKPIPDAVTNYCLDPVLPGPKCLGEQCDVSSNATNCLSGLTCQEGYCIKECTKANEATDCDTASGEICFVAFGQAKGLCQPKPTVTKEGEICTPLQRCDESIGLACIASGDKTVCVKKCNTNDGEKNNKACGATQLCQKPSDTVPFGVCRNAAKLDESCGLTAICTEVPNACITIDQDLGATCLLLCDPKQNKSETDASNPVCDKGAGRCLTLNSAITSGGTAYMGACAPARPKTVEVGNSCEFNKTDKLRSPDCKEGGRCVFLGGTPGPICFTDCDPCESKPKGTEWLHPKCENGTKSCIGLTSGGRPSGGICLPDGKPVKEVGEFCDFQNGCKNPDNVTCVRYSNDADAKSVCSQSCNPAKGTTTNEDCPQNGRCGGLTNGGGVCIPLAKRSRKIGETCNGPIGTTRFDACLEKDGANDIICAEPQITGITGTCQVLCNATNGFKDNSDCKAAGLTNHLCLPSDLTQPQKGACVELCSFSNRKDCSQQQCKYGQCREMILGQRGDCTTPTKETECTDKGGACVNNTCLATVCL